MEPNDRSQSAEYRYRHAAGTVFRTLRSKQGWSLRDFGEKVGAAHTTLYAVERGETTPGIDVLDRVAAAFGMDLSALLSMIVDELHEHSGGQSDSLPALIFAFSRLTPAQRREALQFIDYLQYRSGNPRTNKDIAAG